MNKKWRYIRLSIIFYWNTIIKRITALIFNVDFVIRHHRRPTYMSKEELELFREFLDMKKGGKF